MHNFLKKEQKKRKSMTFLTDTFTLGSFNNSSFKKSNQRYSVLQRILLRSRCFIFHEWSGVHKDIPLSSNGVRSPPEHCNVTGGMTKWLPVGGSFCGKLWNLLKPFWIAPTSRSHSNVCIWRGVCLILCHFLPILMLNSLIFNNSWYLSQARWLHAGHNPALVPKWLCGCPFGGIWWRVRLRSMCISLLLVRC